MPDPASEVFSRMSVYVQKRDRNAPLVFAGREDVLSDLLSGAEMAGQGRDGAGMTRIVYGIPGAGKTSIISEFMSRHQGSKVMVPGKKGKKKRLFAVEMQAGDLDTTPLDFVRGIQEAWQRHCRGMKAGVLRSGRAHFNKTMQLHRISRKKDSEHETVERIGALSENSSIANCINAYFGKDVVVVLLIDEAQNCPGTDQARKIAGALHSASHDGRMVAFYFGLPGTREHLSAGREEGGLCLSRPSTDCAHEICLLESGETQEVVKGTFEALGVSWSNPGWQRYIRSRSFTESTWGTFLKKMERAVIEGASDFPQHVTLGLQSACQTLGERKNELAPSQGADFIQEVQEKHEAAKESYYRGRLQGIESHAASFGAICEKAMSAKSGSIAKSAAKDAIAVGSSGSSMPLSDAQADQVLLRALGKGVLTMDSEWLIAPPDIPSMSSFLRRVLQTNLDNKMPHALRAVQSLNPDSKKPSATMRPNSRNALN